MNFPSAVHKQRKRSAEFRTTRQSNSVTESDRCCRPGLRIKHQPIKRDVRAQARSIEQHGGHATDVVCHDWYGLWLRPTFRTWLRRFVSRRQLADNRAEHAELVLQFQELLAELMPHVFVAEAAADKFLMPPSRERPHNSIEQKRNERPKVPRVRSPLADQVPTHREQIGHALERGRLIPFGVMQRLRRDPSPQLGIELPKPPCDPPPWASTPALALSATGRGSQ